MTFHFTKTAKKQFEKLDPETRKHLVKKLQELKRHPTLLSILEPLHQLEPATHRLRIGEYRLLLSAQGSDCIVYKLGHRRDVYR